MSRVNRILPGGAVLRYSTGLGGVALALLFVWPGLVRNLLATRTDAGQFITREQSFLRIPELVWLHLTSDFLIGLSTVSISLMLASLVYRARRDIPFNGLFLAFAFLIFACGGTHLMEVWTMYNATYWLSGYVKLVTAAASVATALILPPLIPKTLELVQAARLSKERRLKLEKANEELEREVALRTTEVERGLETLAESERRYRSLADAMPQIVWTADADGALDYYNQRWFDYTGMTLEQTRGWGWQPVLHPDDRERALRRWATAIKTGERYEVEYRFKRASDGAYRWHLGRALPMRDEAGRILRWFGTSTDIHDQKLAMEERALLLTREQEARRLAEAAAARLEVLQSITEIALLHMSVGDLIGDLLNRIRETTEVDTAAILLLQEEAGELVAWSARGLEEEVERGVRIPLGKGFAGRIAAEKHPIIIEDLDEADVYNPLLREKGLRSLLGVPLLVEGRVIGVIHIGTLRLHRFSEEETRLLQLIADRVALAIDHARLYDVERAARAEAEEANRTKDEFLATLSHELRTPLTPIIGWTHMMRSGSLGPAEIEHGLAIIDKNSHSLTRLINDLLDMSAILSGKMLIEKNLVLIETALSEAVETVRPDADRHGIEISILPCATTEPLMVAGDRTRLVQVFWNLLTNGVKFSDRGGRVEVACETDGREVRIHFRDRGRGIRPDFLPHVFERFRQADGSKTRSHGGLGLGLALVKSFVEAHDGRVEVESAGEGHGSHFVVHLPRLQPVGSALKEADESPLERSADEEGTRRVLIVEDALDTLNMLKMVFEIRGFETITCESAAEALRVASSMWFDIIISDIGLPEIDGYELLRRLRQMPHLRDVPAVALTGYATQHDEEEAVRAGFDAHIAKPVDPVELSTRIEQMFQQRQTK